MKISLTTRFLQRHAGMTLVEMLVSCTAFAFVMGSIMSSFAMFNKSFALGRDYASARLTLSDYLGMDLRRSTAFTPTLVTSVTHGNWRSTDWTLPLVITVPSYYAADGKTPLPPARVTMTAEEWEAAKDAAFERGKLPPPNWKVVYGTPTNPRIVIYRRDGDRILRQEGYGTVTRPSAKAVSWTWATGQAPLSVEVARGVIQVQGVYQVTEDLTPEDLTELPPEDVQVGFHGNYTIRYLPSVYTKAAPQPASLINNNLLLRTQYYGF